MHESFGVFPQGRPDEVARKTSSSSPKLEEGSGSAEAQAPIPQIWRDFFWSKVAVGKPDECWPFISAKGYGRIKLWGKAYAAHRVAYELTHGPVPITKVICHKCDNPPCCNPAHLFLGTFADNIHDASLKERLFGQKNWKPKEKRRMRNFSTRNLLKVDGIWHYKKVVKGKETRMSLGTRDLELAKAKRNQMEELALAGEWSKLKEKSVRRLPATAGQVIEAYEKGIVTTADRIEPKTVAANVNAFKSYLRWSHGSVGTRNEDLNVAGVSMETLTPAQVAKFRQHYIGTAGEDRVAIEARRRGAASLLRQARSVFSDRAMSLYALLNLPDLAAWKASAQIEAETRVHAVITGDIKRQMHEEITKLRETEPMLWLVHTLSKVAGLRNDELVHARVDWFQRAPWGQVFISVVTRPDFAPKGSEGHVPIALEIAKELGKVLEGKGPNEYLITATSLQARWDMVNRDHAKWIRQFLPANQFAKAGYELRRMAAQAMETKYGREAAEAFLRHAPKSVAERHYLERFFPWRRFGENVGLEWADVTGANDRDKDQGEWMAGASALDFSQAEVKLPTKPQRAQITQK